MFKSEKELTDFLENIIPHKVVSDFNAQTEYNFYDIVIHNAKSSGYIIDPCVVEADRVYNELQSSNEFSDRDINKLWKALEKQHQAIEFLKQK